MAKKALQIILLQKLSGAKTAVKERSATNLVEHIFNEENPVADGSVAPQFINYTTR